MHSSSHGPRFSIITVCYNAADLIEKSIISLLDQDFRDFEYIIKDGQSTDNTVEYASSLLQSHAMKGTALSTGQYLIFSTPDTGIYDAMNQAVESASGDYIYFLNAGDTFADSSVLRRVSGFLDTNPAADIVFGNVYEEFSDRKILRRHGVKNTKKWYYALGACINHQTMFCRRDLFNEKPFDIRFPITADREWQMYHILQNKKTALFLDYPIAIYLRGGYSEQNIQRLETETADCVRKYCGIWYIMYKVLSLVKKNVILHKFITKLEALINTR